MRSRASSLSAAAGRDRASDFSGLDSTRSPLPDGFGLAGLLVVAAMLHEANRRGHPDARRMAKAAIPGPKKTNAGLLGSPASVSLLGRLRRHSTLMPFSLKYFRAPGCQGMPARLEVCH